MHYYLYIREMTTSGANKTEGSFTTLDAVKQAYHQRVATCLQPNDIIGYVAIVFDDNGWIYVNEKWGTMEQPTA